MQPLTSQSSAFPTTFVPRRRKAAQTDRVADTGGPAQRHRVAEACPAQQTYHTATQATEELDRVADSMAAPDDRVADADRVADDTKSAVTTNPFGSQQVVPPANPTADISDEDVADGEATDLDLDSVMSWDSNDSMSTNDIDEGLGLETLSQWRTLEDAEQDAIKKVATHLRAKPLLPPPLDQHSSEAVDNMSGVVYPTIHCAIHGCSWCSATQPCAPNYTKNQMWILKNLKWTHPDKTCCSDASRCLWAHLQSSHAQVFADFDRTDIPSTYLAALFVKEDATVPQVGWSIDRRTFRRMSQELQEHNLVGLCCACCTRTHVGTTNGEIGYVPVKQHFSNLTLQSYTANWCYETYRRNYGAHPAIKKRLAETEWVRHVPGHGQILCCPEDIRCKHCQPGAQTLCEACELPLCRSCLTRMTQQSYNAVPQALTNDNWVGYPTELLYQHQVRWIEAAAACPVWTSMVCYYLEADRGHLMDEDIHRADHRIAVRGNVSSFSMPWEEILATLDPTRDGHKTWGALPHSKNTLRALVKISVKGMRHNEAIQWVSGAKIRPWVVTALLHHLIDLQHPMCTAIDSPDMAKEKVSERVTLAYGTDETEPLVDSPPDAAQPSTADRVAERTQPVVDIPLHAAQPLRTPLKHATPELSAETSLTGEAFTGSLRPNILSQDYAGAQVHDAESNLVASLASTTDNMTIETGHSFWDQWKNDFVYWAFPFSLPAPTGGPDFPQKPRPRRLADAPTFTPLAHLKHLTGRIESSIRNSWDLVPGMRRITGKWDSVWNGHLWRKWHMNRKSIETVPVAEWVQAAQGLYKKLQKGKYISADGRERPIQYDTRKLYYAKGLTTPEHQLLQDVRSMQTTVPGTIEARRRIGRFLFGARVELGEPLFITISPTTRHNALCLKLSRYRVADPGRGPCSSMTFPPLWEAASMEVDTPGYDVRREVTARDPWAVVLSFQSIVRLIFAQLLGIRMCFRCPNCDCRDVNGHASHPAGGILGLVRGLHVWRHRISKQFHATLPLQRVPGIHLATAFAGVANKNQTKRNHIRRDLSISDVAPQRNAPEAGTACSTSGKFRKGMERKF